jgi:hypothetical protein
MKTLTLFIALIWGSQINAQNSNYQWLRDSILIPTHLEFTDTILKINRTNKINRHTVFHYSILENQLNNDTVTVICNYMLNENNIDYFYRNYYFNYKNDTIVAYLEGVNKINLDTYGLFQWNEKIKYNLKDHLFPADLGAFTYSSCAMVVIFVKGKPKDYKVYERMEWVPEVRRVFRFGW